MPHGVAELVRLPDADRTKGEQGSGTVRRPASTTISPGRTPSQISVWSKTVSVIDLDASIAVLRDTMEGLQRLMLQRVK
jgi:hypothetical protein